MQLPDYKKMAENLYNIAVNYEATETVSLTEIEHALRHAQQVGETIGYQKGFDEARLQLQKEYL